MEGIDGEEVGKMVKERAQAVQEINDVCFFPPNSSTSAYTSLIDAT